MIPFQPGYRAEGTLPRWTEGPGAGGMWKESPDDFLVGGAQRPARGGMKTHKNKQGKNEFRDGRREAAGRAAAPLQACRPRGQRSR